MVTGSLASRVPIGFRPVEGTEKVWSSVGVVNEDADLGWVVGTGEGLVGASGRFDTLP